MECAVFNLLEKRSLVALALSALLSSVLTFALACSEDTAPSDSSPTAAPTAGRPQGLTTARVIDIVSGTAIEVDIEGRKYTVRYMGIEVPRDELAADERASGEEALAFNRFLVEGRTVELEQGVVDTDLRGDLLRYVYVGGEMVNKALVTNGYATVADFPPDFHYQTEFLIAEENAKVNSRGIWKSSTPGGETTSRTPDPQFTGGTLPQLPKPAIVPAEGGYSGTAEAVIKGNVDSRTGEHIYHVPGGFFYGTTVVDEGRGDVWLCTETEAEAAGWKRSKR